VAVAGEHGRRLDELEGDLKRLRRERDEAIRRAYRAGLPLSDIADAIRLSRQAGIDDRLGLCNRRAFNHARRAQS
jgi:hypothetical protein